MAKSGFWDGDLSLNPALFSSIKEKMGHSRTLECFEGLNKGLCVQIMKNNQEISENILRLTLDVFLENSLI